MLSVSAGDVRSTEFTALHPRQRVPVLKDDGFVLTESVAILAYLDQKHPKPPLFGDDHMRAAQVWRIAMDGAHYLRDAGAAFLRPILTQTADPTDPALDTAASKMHAEHAKLEALLSEFPCLAGEQLSLADIICFPEVRLLLRGIERMPQLMEKLGVAPMQLAIAHRCLGGKDRGTPGIRTYLPSGAVDIRTAPAVKPSKTIKFDRIATGAGPVVASDGTLLYRRSPRHPHVLRP